MFGKQQQKLLFETLGRYKEGFSINTEVQNNPDTETSLQRCSQIADKQHSQR